MSKFRQRAIFALAEVAHELGASDKELNIYVRDLELMSDDELEQEIVNQGLDLNKLKESVS